MHAVALQLAPVLGAEKSKAPFYVAGGLLVAWALILSLGIGLRRASFPGSDAGARAVIAITAVLVLAAVSTAVLTAGTPAKGSTAPAAAGASGGASSAASALELAANPGGQLSFDTTHLSAKAGAVTITITNGSPLEHNVTIAKGSTVLGATPSFIGGKRTLTLTLKPGSYTFYCSIPGHRQGGMEGTLSVS